MEYYADKVKIEENNLFLPTFILDSLYNRVYFIASTVFVPKTTAIERYS